MKKKNNFSLARVLSPTFLDHNLQESDQQDNFEFFNSFAGRKAMVKLLKEYFYHVNSYLNLLNSRKKDQAFGDINVYQMKLEYAALEESIAQTIRCILDIDYDTTKIRKLTGSSGSSELTANLLALISACDKMDSEPVDAQARKKFVSDIKAKEPDDTGFFDKVKSIFGSAVDTLRGYDDAEQQYSLSDSEFYNIISKPEYDARSTQTVEQAELQKSLQDKAKKFDDLGNVAEDPAVKATNQAFSNNGVKNMKLRKSVRKTFSNEQACDMLAHKLTNDWFVCEPQCQPMIAEQLKMAKVPAATFAPALLCNRFQYDGEAPVCKSELAALDRVQMFIQALKDEIAAGNDCGGIKMVPEAKVFALKRALKQRLKRCFDAGELDPSELGTPPEIIEAEEANIEIEDPKKYVAVAEAAEAGELHPDMMGAPAVVAPVSMDPAAMGRAYDAVVDSTIADNSGITQNDMSGYEAEQGQLSLSAAEIGDEMAQAQANAVIVGGEAPAPAPIQPVMAPVAPQNFSRSVRRQQMQKNAQRQNFAARPVRQPVQQVQRISIKGLRGLLGDNYVK